MIKQLRFVLLSTLMMLTAAVSAQNFVTFIAGEDEGTQTSANAPDEMSKQGITISVTKGAFAAPQFRFAKGSTMTITSTVGNITSVAFECTASGDAQYGPGNFTDPSSGMYVYEDNAGVWVGNASQMSLTASGAQVRASTIVVTIDGEPGPTPGPGDDDDDDDGYEYLTGKITETANQILFDFTATDGKINVYGQMVFNFENDICTSATMTMNFPTEADAQKAYQEALAEAEEEGIVNVTLNGKTVTAEMTELVGMNREVIKMTLALMMGEDTEIVKGSGTLEDPYTATDANLLVSMLLDKGETTEWDVFVKGKVSQIRYSFSQDHGTATFYISEDGTTNNEFYVYSAYFLENKPWVEGNTQIQVGDEVIVYGRLTNYNGTPETASKQAYVYSLNGKTSEQAVTPEVKQINVKQALDIISELEASQKTTETYRVKGYVVLAPDFQRKDDGSLYGNVNFNIADEKGGMPQLTVFRAKGFDNEPFTEATMSMLKENDEVIVEGQLQRYVSNGIETPELVSGHVVSINGRTAISDITRDAQPKAVYNLQGQRVEQLRSGLYIIDGRKVMVK